VKKPPKAPNESLGELDSEAAAKLISAFADIALIIDGDGVIRDLSIGSDELAKEGYEDWLGQSWSETVTSDSRPKIEALLKDAATKSAPIWRQVNHPSSRGAPVPIQYSAIRVGRNGHVAAVGRSLRAVAAMQQRLVDAQNSLEKDYSRLHHAETRYRLLFQIASEAILIVDAASLKVVEANPAAMQLLSNLKDVVGWQLPDGFDKASAQALTTMLASVRATGRAEEVRARLVEGDHEFFFSASLFRQENASHFLVRLAQVQSRSASAISAKHVAGKSAAMEVLAKSPDGFLITDLQGRILTANRAFLDLAQLAAEDLARGESLDRWLGRPGVDLNVLTANLRQHGSVRLFSTMLRGELGSATDVEISAVAVPEGDPPCFGFTIRNVGRRLPADSRPTPELPRSVEQLTELIGRVPLKDLVRETTDVIERLCIEAALELTGDNRASAAEMLGLSRQSLYVKLRRFGIADSAPDDAEPAGG